MPIEQDLIAEARKFAERQFGKPKSHEIVTPEQAFELMADFAKQCLSRRDGEWVKAAKPLMAKLNAYERQNPYYGQIESTELEGQTSEVADICECGHRLDDHTRLESVKFKCLMPNCDCKRVQRQTSEPASGKTE